MRRDAHNAANGTSVVYWRNLAFAPNPARCDFMIVRTNPSVATSGYKRGTESKPTGGGRQGRRPQCRPCSIRVCSHKTIGLLCGATQPQSGQRMRGLDGSWLFSRSSSRSTTVLSATGLMPTYYDLVRICELAAGRGISQKRVQMSFSSRIQVRFLAARPTPRAEDADFLQPSVEWQPAMSESNHQSDHSHK